MTIDQHILANADDAAALAAYQADPASWQVVASKYVLAWLGESARLAKLKGFIGQPTTDPQVIGLQSAVETVLLAVANPDTELLLDPASLHRQMLLALVAAGVLTQADADALIVRGRPAGFVDYAVEQVTARRLDLALAAAKNARLVLIEQWASYARRAVNAATSADALPAVPEVPNP